MFDPVILRRLMIERLQCSGTAIHTASDVIDLRRSGKSGFELSIKDKGKAGFDAVVNCSYQGVNSLTARLGHAIETRQYEYVAVPVIELDWPEPVSVTILDGPFTSLLPFVGAGRYLLYHVQHAVIARADAPLPDPAWLDPRTSPFAAVDKRQWFEAQLASCCSFMPALREARLVGVQQGTRMVLAGCDDTDARPSIVTLHEPGYVSVFSGKVDHSIWVADEVARELGCWREPLSRPPPGQSVSRRMVR